MARGCVCRVPQLSMTHVWHGDVAKGICPNAVYLRIATRNAEHITLSFFLRASTPQHLETSLLKMMEVQTQNDKPRVSAAAQESAGQKRKRLRAVIVCTYCRRRKVKCDKQLPCSNCVKVGIADTCTYDSHTDKKGKDKYEMELALPLGQQPMDLVAKEANIGVSGQFAVASGAGTAKSAQNGPKRIRSEKGLTALAPSSAYSAASSHDQSAGNLAYGTTNRAPSGPIMGPLNGAPNVSGVSPAGSVPNYGEPNASSTASMSSASGATTNFTSPSTYSGGGQTPGYAGFERPANATIKTMPRSRVDLKQADTQTIETQKSEIEVLKQRLQQIEKTLMGSPKSLPALSAQPNAFPPMPMQPSAPPSLQLQFQGPQQPSSMQPLGVQPAPFQLGQRPSYYPGMTPGTIPMPSSSAFTPLSQRNSFSEDPMLAMLPPLNSNLKRSGGSQSPLQANPVGPFPQSVKPAASESSSATGCESACNATSTACNTSPATTETPPKLTIENPKAEDFLIGVNIYSNASDTINFYENYSSLHFKDNLRRSNFGPFAWTSLMKRDYGLRLIWDHIIAQKQSTKDDSSALAFPQQTNEITAENTNTILHADKSEHLEKQFRKRALQADGYEDIIPYNTILEAKKERDIQKQTLNQSTLPLGLTFYDGQIDRELQLIEKVRVVLPKKRVIWKLIARFFKCVYSYFPFLDEEYFRRDVSRIIGPESYEDELVPDIKIERKLDLATVGILLIVLRLAYLSVFSNNTELNEQILRSEAPTLEVQSIKCLMLNPININIIDVAELCFEQFKLLRRSNFTVLQLALYIRLYHTYAPEDGDGADGGDSQVLNAVLIQMAYSLGLNREPDEQCTDLKINNLSRKIWSYLTLADLHLAYAFGNPMSIDTMYADVKPPLYIPGGENLLDKEADHLIVDRFNSCTFWYPDIRRILKLTLDVNGRVPLPELCSLLSNAELDWFQKCGTLSEALKCGGLGVKSTVERNYTVKIYLALRVSFLAIFFHIFLHYERKNDHVSFFYLKKCLLITTADIMPHYETLLCKSEVVSDMIINPTLEMAVHKANIIYLAAIIRVNFAVYHLRQSSEHDQRCKNDKQYLTYFQKLCQLSSCLTRASEYSISAISKISNRYYYAWRITKGQTFMLKTVTSTQFYESNYHAAYLLYSTRFSCQQIDELICICETTLSKLRHTEFRTYGFSKEVNDQLVKCQQYSCDPVRNASNSSESTSVSGHSASTDSISTDDPTNLVTNTEVDKLWLQLLSMKHDQLFNEDYREAPEVMVTNGNGTTNKPNSQNHEASAGAATTNDFARFGYDMEMENRYDCFSDLPFDQVFNF